LSCNAQSPGIRRIINWAVPRFPFLDGLAPVHAVRGFPFRELFYFSVFFSSFFFFQVGLSNAISRRLEFYSTSHCAIFFGEVAFSIVFNFVRLCFLRLFRQNSPFVFFSTRDWKEYKVLDLFSGIWVHSNLFFPIFPWM